MLVCPFELIPDSLKVLTDTIKFLSVLAKKSIMIKWAGADTPHLFHLWESPVSDFVAVEWFRYCINEECIFLCQSGTF